MRATSRRKDGSGEVREEYDFSHGVRGKYATRFARGSNVVVLAPDVAEAFPTEKAVNSALRRQIPRRAKSGPRRSRSHTSRQ